jgi:hypothetical protein
MKRERLLLLIGYAGYHEDEHKFMRLYTENRISYQAAIKAFRDGKTSRKNGMRCNCSDCNQKP